MTPDLTLNYGLRWDTSQPFYDTKNRIQTFVPGVQSKIYPDAPEGFVFPGDPGLPGTLAPTQYNRFAPRLGRCLLPERDRGLAGKTSVVREDQHSGWWRHVLHRDRRRHTV